MDLVLSPRGSDPIYEQIRSQIAAQILDGSLAAGEMLPSIRSVAKELGISVITIKKAWELLEADDLIYTRQGKGAYVSEHAADGLSAKRHAFAVERFRTNVDYYRSLGLTREELIRIVEEEY
ncbi:GntR family transcriptional regulator [Georgenia sp. Z1344]|uniref:GntR family transcriptional regulator n=1 Tax=Georgenia sp. Z1344 TaxID=3416706 RepID=UPI003CF94302